MSYKKFDSNDIVKNTIKTYPENDIVFMSGNIYINSTNQFLASDNKNSHVIAGNPLNLGDGSGNYSTSYILNSVNSSVTSIFPRNMTDSEKYSDTVKAEYSRNYYPSSSIQVLYLNQSSNDSPYLRALKNTLDWYSPVSDCYSYNKYTGLNLALINIPSIFYGSSVKRGSVEIKYNYTGTLVSTLSDYRSNGELVETYGPNSGSVAGCILYDEGIIILSGSWDLPSANTTKWNMFASGSTANIYSSGSYSFSFKGTNVIQTLTMLAHAEKNEYNNSANSTYIDHSQLNFNYVTTGSNTYVENFNTLIKNTIKTDYSTVSGSFKKQTFINKVAIYDENKNLIAVAKLATPVKKNVDREYTFKLKLDL